MWFYLKVNKKICKLFFCQGWGFANTRKKNRNKIFCYKGSLL